MAIAKLITRLNNKTWSIHKSKITKRTMNSDWSDRRHNTKLQNTCT